MANRIRRRIRYFWTHGQPCGPWHNSPAYGPNWGWGRWYGPSSDEEKEMLDEYIDMLNEELEEAKEYRKELEERI